jgi:phenylpropionate dioxygenase-like ring-hydroxylating dioxygenase large terminal subunit
MSDSTANIDYQEVVTLKHPRLGSHPIPVTPYVSPDFAELEKNKIFSKKWLFGCHENEIPTPGDYIVKNIDLLGVSLILIRGEDHQVRAFHNVCPHRGNQIISNACKGKAKGKRLVCNFHGWVFSTDGSLADITGDEHYFNIDRNNLGLPPIHVELWKGWVFFNVDPEPSESLVDFLGSLPETFGDYPSENLKVLNTWSGALQANWKVVMDGFQEAYHEISVHKSSSPDLHTWADNPFARPAYFRDHGIHRTLTIGANPNLKPSPTGALVGELLSGVFDRAAKQGALGINPAQIPNFHFDLNGVFPNTLIIPFAGACATMEFIPVSAASSVLTVKFYASKDLSWSERIAWEYPIIFLREAIIEDMAVLEATQRGMSSGAIKEIVFGDCEIGPRHLITTVNEVVND